MLEKNAGPYFSLTVSPPLEVAERHDLDQIIECHRLLTAGFADLPVKFPPKRHELFAQALLLVLASGAEIGAVRRARDPDDPVFAATDTTDDAQGRTGPLALSSAGFGGGGMKP